MDPITLSLSLAVVSGFASGLTDVGKDSISGLYNSIKEKLLKKSEQHAKSSNLPGAIENLEKEPSSSQAKEDLAKEIEKIDADKDIELIKMAINLMELIQSSPNQNTSQYIKGNYNAVAGAGGTASINIDDKKK